MTSMQNKDWQTNWNIASNEEAQANIIRPIQYLSIASKLYPNATKLVNELRDGRGKDLPNWPDWCFVPIAGWYAIVSAGHGVPSLSLPLIADVAKLTAIGTWRYSQGIYRIHPDLLSALSESVVSGSIPSEVLYRLPEWCLYIETPNYKWLDNKMFGFWVHLEWDANTKHTELRLLLDCEKDLIIMPLHIGSWTVTEAVDRAINESANQAKKLGMNLDVSADIIQALSDSINPLISIILYLCSEEPEINNDREPGKYPSRPESKKTKSGWRLFQPDNYKIWKIGEKIGEQLRNSTVESEANDKNDSAGAGRTIRAHLRRGHWHGYWTGPRAGERKFVYRWLSPLVVGTQ
jgi:hypothetical protein